MYVSYSCIPSSSANSTLFSPKRSASNTLTFSHPQAAAQTPAHKQPPHSNPTTTYSHPHRLPPPPPQQTTVVEYGFTSASHPSPAYHPYGSLHKSPSNFPSNNHQPTAPHNPVDALVAGSFGRHQPQSAANNNTNRHPHIRYTAMPPTGADRGQPALGTAPYIEDFDSQGDLAIPPHNCSSALLDHHQSIDNYEMPKSYPLFVTRSPLRSRANPPHGSRSGESPSQSTLRSPMNFVDQIREPPPGYRAVGVGGGVQPVPPQVTVTRMGSMPRTKSHDRIAQRRQQQAAGKQRLRPRSYCSNIVSDSFMNA